MAPQPPYAQCSVCSSLSNYQRGFQKHGREDEDPFLPEAAGKLRVVKDLKPGGGIRQLELCQCPECRTYYLYKTEYEYLATGTEDEQELTRLSGEEAQQCLSPPPPNPLQ